MTGTRPSRLALGAIAAVDGEAIHYIEAGEGSPVVLIHGFPSNTFVWSRVMPRMAEHHRTVALDLPGLGYSHRNRTRSFALEAHARTVTGLMDTLGIERASIVGLSMGGGVAERIALTFPERVERLILLAAIDESDGSTWQNHWGDLLVLSAALRVAPLARLVAGISLRRVVEDPAFVTPELIERYVRPLLRRGTVPCLRRYLWDNRAAARADLSRIAVPTLVIIGERDGSVRPEVGERLVAKIPGARRVVLERANHLIALERSEDVYVEVERFLHESAVSPS
ncbi:MAG: alpha/beta hydrolase [Actinomycetota bacterium]|nr:alpha/beta hydrolase [Actinomycetota bacterium]